MIKGQGDKGTKSGTRRTTGMCICAGVRVYACACVGVRVCGRACGRVCVCVCARVCGCVYVYACSVEGKQFVQHEPKKQKSLALCSD